MPLGHGPVGAHFNGSRIVIQRFRGRHILGNIHQHRPWPAGCRDVERLLDCLGEISDILDKKIVLHTWAGNADGVALLECILADGMRGYLAGKHDHGDGVHVSRRNTSNGIGHAGAGGDQSNAWFAGRARVGVGRVQRGLFVAHENMRKRFLLVDFVVNDQHRAAGVTEEEFNSLGFEGTANDFGTAQ